MPTEEVGELERQLLGSLVALNSTEATEKGEDLSGERMRGNSLVRD